MKSTILGIIALSLLLFTACATSKNKSELALENTSWELEYISETDQPMNELFPSKLPSLVFQESSKKVEGTDGCNGYSSGYTISENTISFGEPGPATLMYCGTGEQLFRNALKKTNNYSVDKDGILHLFMDDIPLLRFKKLE